MRSLRALMWRQVGLERHAKGMTTAQRSLRFWSEHQAKGALHSPPGWELQNMLLLASLVTRAASDRKASVGTHLRSDSSGEIDTRHYVYQRPDSAW